MTNFEKIKSLSIEELAGWINTVIPFNDNNEPWNKWFNEKYCDGCESVYTHYEWGGVEFPISFCEHEGYCRFFPYYISPLDTKDVITMWLKREEEEQHL